MTASMSRCARQQVGHQVELRVAPRRDVDVVGDDEPGSPTAAAASVSHCRRSHRCRATHASVCRTRGRGGSRHRASRPRCGARLGRDGSRSRAVELSQCRRVLSGANAMSASSRPRPSTRPALDSTGSSMRLQSIWKPPQMPSTGLPLPACAVMPVGEAAFAAASPGRTRSPCCRGSPPRRRRRGRRDRSPSAPARRARTPAPRRRWSSRCAAAGSRPPAASPRRAAAAGPRRRGVRAPTPNPRCRATARRCRG